MLSRTLLEEYAAERVFVKKGHHLVLEGAQTSSVYFQLTGWASAECVSQRGERVLMDFLTAGDFIGLADEGPCAAYSVTAMTDLLALRIERSQLQELIDYDQAFREICFGVLRSALLRTRSRRLALSAKSGLSKVCQVLSDLAERAEALSTYAANDFTRPRLPLSQVILASAVGLTPVAVNRIVQSLRRAGLIDWGVSGVSILDTRRLREFA
ncbi:MAG: Crp/Fnr family transcriptional regulator [Caulobacterales bacterium]